MQSINNLNFALLVRALTKTTAVFRNAPVTELRCARRKKKEKIHQTIIKEEHTTNTNHLKKAPISWRYID